MNAPIDTSPHGPGLQIYNQLLGLDDLHYGIWRDEPRTLDGLKAAQERYTRTLLDRIPEGVRTVLDVGCGYGGVALALKDRGFEVAGLTPDDDQRQAFEARTGFPCYLAKFQEFAPERTFDLVLMSQSVHHLPLAEIFPRVARAAPGGHFLACNYFLTARDGTRFTRKGQLIDQLLAAARTHGFDLVHDDDITEDVLPTLDVARDIVENRVVPALSILKQAALRKRPWLTKAALWLLRKEIKRFDERRRYVDRDAFVAVKCYRRLLFRVPRGA